MNILFLDIDGVLNRCDGSGLTPELAREIISRFSDTPTTPKP